MSNKQYSKMNYENNDYDDNYDDNYDGNFEEEFYQEETEVQVEAPEQYPEEIEVYIPQQEEVVYAEEPKDSWEDDDIELNLTTTTPTLFERADNKATVAPSNNLAARMQELLVWCEYMGFGINEMPGNFEEKYEEMVWNKSVESKKLSQRVAEREEQERAERAAKGAANLVRLEKAKKSEGKKRAAEQVGPNSKGKLQGASTGVSKHERKAAQARKENATKPRVLEIAEPKSCLVIPQIELIQTGNVKSNVSAPAPSVDVVAEIEDACEKTEIVIREQIVIEEKPVEMINKPTRSEVQKIMDEANNFFILVTSRKSKKVSKSSKSSKLTSGDVLKTLFIQSKSVIMPQKPALVSQVKHVSEAKTENKVFDVKDLGFTKMCTSVTSGKPCLHGSRCRFAHNFEKLQKKPCGFSATCRFTSCSSTGVYKNKPCPQTGKICSFWHENETVQSYAKRLGLPVPKEQKPIVVLPVQKPIVIAPVAPKLVVSEPKMTKTELKSIPATDFIIRPVEVFVSTTTKLAPWARLTVIVRIQSPVVIELSQVKKAPVVVVDAPVLVVDAPVVVVDAPVVVVDAPVLVVDAPVVVVDAPVLVVDAPVLVVDAPVVVVDAPVLVVDAPKVRKSRWGPEISNTVVDAPKVRKSRWGPEISNTVVETPKIRKSRWGPEIRKTVQADSDSDSDSDSDYSSDSSSEEEYKPRAKQAKSPVKTSAVKNNDSDTVIMEVPRSMQELALKTCLAMGHKKFKIVLTD
jgi:Putative zinc finger protein